MKTSETKLKQLKERFEKEMELTRSSAEKLLEKNEEAIKELEEKGDITICRT